MAGLFGSLGKMFGLRAEPPPPDAAALQAMARLQRIATAATVAAAPPAPAAPAPLPAMGVAAMQRGVSIFARGQQGRALLEPMLIASVAVAHRHWLEPGQGFEAAFQRFCAAQERQLAPGALLGTFTRGNLLEPQLDALVTREFLCVLAAVAGAPKTHWLNFLVHDPNLAILIAERLNKTPIVDEEEAGIVLAYLRSETLGDAVDEGTSRLVPSLRLLLRKLEKLPAGALAALPDAAALAEHICTVAPGLERIAPDAADIAARFDALLRPGHRPPPPPREPLPAPRPAPPPGRIKVESQVAAYVAAIERHLGELREWVAQAPATRIFTLQTMAEKQAEFDPLTSLSGMLARAMGKPEDDREMRQAAARLRHPVDGFAHCIPPAPEYLRHGNQTLRRLRAAGLLDPLEIGVHPRDILELVRNDCAGLANAICTAWLDAARPVLEREAQARPALSYQGDAIAGRAALSAPQTGGEALFELLTSANAPEPNQQWLNMARGLQLRHGAAALAAARAWLQPLADATVTSTAVDDFVLASRYRHFTGKIGSWIAMFDSPDEAAQAALLVKPGAPADWRWSDRDAPDAREAPLFYISMDNETVLRGAVWLLSLDDSPAATAMLSKLAVKLMFKRDMHDSAPLSLKGANACVWSLGRIGTQEAVAALLRIRRKSRDGRLHNAIVKALGEAASKGGVTAAELEELSVDSHGLEAEGRAVAQLAGHRVLLEPDGVTIFAAAGKKAKGVPAALKADAEAMESLKALQANARELAQAMPAQCLRLERGWLSSRSWSRFEFQERFLAHPLMSWFVPRLIWCVASEGGAQGRSFMLRGGGAIDPHGNQVAPAAEDERVALWHPALDAAGEAAAWQALVKKEKIAQPFKQAAREVYALTPDEAAAGHVGRFAGRRLSQHVSITAAKARGWSAPLRMILGEGGDAPPHLKIPAHMLAVEMAAAAPDGRNATPGGAHVILDSGPVVFRRLADGGDWRRDGGKLLALGGAVPLAGVPPLVFSEALREIDLFVAKA